ncbi:MAG: acyl-CoA thioesterase [Planctomycetes bacterium]|nr:acyl-CoA thioesterase [Planctomycetota bacterium]
MSVLHYWDVTFGDADPAGIAYYPRILDACHRAFETFFAQAVKEPYAQTFLREDVGFPTVSLTAEFRSPMRFGDRMRIEVDVSALSARSVTFRYRFTRESDGIHCATIRNVTVAIARGRFAAVSIPSRYREVFQSHLHEQGDSEQK